MVTTCFSCQNLLSDYLEGILPSLRHDEISKHLESCAKCREEKKDLEGTLSVLKQVALHPMSQTLSLGIEEAALKGKKRGITRQGMIKTAAFSAIPLILFFALSFVFPTLFPWVSYLRNYEDDSNFARYFPLLQGASEIIDEQANWLSSREPFSGSVWEEGGMTPEEYEKMFQKKPREQSDP